MKRADYTVKVLVPEEGYFLTQAGVDVPDGARVVSERVFLAVTDAEENWREITAEEAEAIRARKEGILSAEGEAAPEDKQEEAEASPEDKPEEAEAAPGDEPEAGGEAAPEDKQEAEASPGDKPETAPGDEPEAEGAETADEAAGAAGEPDGTDIY
ncbi:MAG: hypothetical protein K2F87_00055 [Muribaculaceae bacterium]|nr:hypothetical protein [Muribaculaceae bacterium]